MTTTNLRAGAGAWAAGLRCVIGDPRGRVGGTRESKQEIWNRRCTRMHADWTVPIAPARLLKFGCGVPAVDEPAGLRPIRVHLRFQISCLAACRTVPPERGTVWRRRRPRHDRRGGTNWSSGAGHAAAPCVRLGDYVCGLQGGPVAASATGTLGATTEAGAPGAGTGRNGFDRRLTDEKAQHAPDPFAGLLRQCQIRVLPVFLVEPLLPPSHFHDDVAEAAAIAVDRHEHPVPERSVAQAGGDAEIAADIDDGPADGAAAHLGLELRHAGQGVERERLLRAGAAGRARCRLLRRRRFGRLRCGGYGRGRIRWAGRWVPRRGGHERAAPGSPGPGRVPRAAAAYAPARRPA